MSKEKTNAQIAAGIVNAWGRNDVNDPHAGDALRGRIEAALDAKDRALPEPTEDAQTPQPAAQVVGEADEYIGWCCYVHHGQYEDSGADIITFETCDSDAKGAFKVYAKSQSCPNCADMQRAVTQTARANRSLEKQCAEAQKAQVDREAIIRECAEAQCFMCAGLKGWKPAERNGAAWWHQSRLTINTSMCKATLILALLNPKGSEQ